MVRCLAGDGDAVGRRRNPVASEAAHIEWHRAEGPELEVNGLALSAFCQMPFARGDFTLSYQSDILVSEDAYGSVDFQEWLMQFDGLKLYFP